MKTASLTRASRTTPRAAYIALFIGLAGFADAGPPAFGRITRPIQPPPVFRSGVELIEFDVLVEDSDGNTINGLTTDDFELTYDGHVIPIATFRAVAAHGESPADSRYVILLLDDIVTPPIRTSNIRTIARAFADRMREYDVGAVLLLNGSSFSTTRDRSAVLQAIDQFTYSGPALGYQFSDYALNTIGDICKQLARVEHRRKTLVYVGTATIFAPSVPIGRSRTQRAYSASWFEAIAAAATANVAVYVIDPTGLTGGKYDGAISFADETGGAAITNSNLFDKSVERVWREASDYYLLGCELPAAAQRRSSVKVRCRNPSLRVRTRRGTDRH